MKKGVCVGFVSLLVVLIVGVMAPAGSSAYAWTVHWTNNTRTPLVALCHCIPQPSGPWIPFACSQMGPYTIHPGDSGDLTCEPGRTLGVERSGRTRFIVVFREDEGYPKDWRWNVFYVDEDFEQKGGPGSSENPIQVNSLRRGLN